MITRRGDANAEGITVAGEPIKRPTTNGEDSDGVSNVNLSLRAFLPSSVENSEPEVENSIPVHATKLRQWRYISSHCPGPQAKKQPTGQSTVGRNERKAAHAPSALLIQRCAETRYLRRRRAFSSLKNDD